MIGQTFLNDVGSRSRLRSFRTLGFLGGCPTGALAAPAAHLEGVRPRDWSMRMVLAGSARDDH